MLRATIQHKFINELAPLMARMFGKNVMPYTQRKKNEGRWNN